MLVNILNIKLLYKFCEKNYKYFATFSAISIFLVTYYIFKFIPADFQQGHVAKLIYIHVPSAVLSLGLFAFMALLASLYLIYRIKIAFMLIRATVPVGLMLTILVLITGMIWGKPTWGTWWIWDARLTSELILGFLYFMIYTIDKSINNDDKLSWVVAVLVIVGAIDLPIIHYSVTWWNTLHQGPSILALQKPTIAFEMLWPLIIMIILISILAFSLIMLRFSLIVSQCEKKSKWLKNVRKI